MLAPLHQHDLAPAAAARFAASVGIRPDERVVEVGAGLGNLCAALVAAGAVVHAIEIDPQRVVALRRRFDGEPRVQVHAGDALRLRLPLPGRWRVVANPPFALTAPLLSRWLLELTPWRLDLVLQREAAQKLCGPTRTGVLLAAAGAAAITGGLRRDEVSPPARVDLCAWRWQRADHAPPPALLVRLDRLLERGFAGPRTMREAMRGLATPEILRRQGAAHGWHPDGHPRTVPPAAWLALAEFLGGIGRL